MDYSKWETKDGMELNIADMSEDYIKNCIQFLMDGLDYFEIKQGNHTPLIRKGYEDLPEPPEPVGWRWYLEHGWNYVNAFENELARRKM